MRTNHASPIAQFCPPKARPELCPRHCDHPPVSRRTAPRSLSCISIAALFLLTLGWNAPVWARGPVSEKARDVALAQSARASATGSQAVFVNPAALSLSPEFTTTAQYRLDTFNRTHGLSAYVHDSLNNARFALALSYVFMKGKPEVGYIDAQGKQQNLSLSHFGHEAGLQVGVSVLPKWIYLGAALKYQYASLRYLDAQKQGQAVLPTLNTVGLDAGLVGTLGPWLRLAVVGYNLIGSHQSNFSTQAPVQLQNVNQLNGSYLSLDHAYPLSDYPLTLAHGLSVLPLPGDKLSLNFDGTYDFTSYYQKPQKFVRKSYGGSIEFKLGPVPLRMGGQWDSMGPDSKDDRVFIAGGLGFFKKASAGKTGFDVAAGVSQQIRKQAGLATVIGISLSFHMHPQL